MRLDVYLTEKNYYSSRSQASLAIKERRVQVNSRTITKAGYEVEENDIVTVKKQQYTFVSRGGQKLLEALNKFDINLTDKIVLDIGASTGGFSDCALQFKAKKVYAYDVGEGQLAEKLRNDPRVVVKEKINARYLKKEVFKDVIDFICMDVSFISCTKIFEAISNILNDNKEAVILFKPQFEVGNKYLNKQGIVTDDKIILEKLNETINIANSNDLSVMGICSSPIKGGDGNKEYLLYFKKGIISNRISEVEHLC